MLFHSIYNDRGDIVGAHLLGVLSRYVFFGGSKYIIPSQEMVGRRELDGWCFGVVGFDWNNNNNNNNNMVRGVQKLTLREGFVVVKPWYLGGTSL